MYMDKHIRLRCSWLGRKEGHNDIVLDFTLNLTRKK